MKVASAVKGADALLVHQWRLWGEWHGSLTQDAIKGMQAVASAPPCPIPLMRGISSSGIHRNANETESGDVLSTTYAALQYWNSTLATHEWNEENALLTHARWLEDHEAAVAPGAGGWPVPVASGRVLSATMQGLALVVLARAYLLTGQEHFIACARRAVQTFALDILDGGVCAPVGIGQGTGIVFEAEALYPAAHTLEAFLIAILSLYDFAALTGDIQAGALARDGHATLHELLAAYDAGYRTRSDLLDAPFTDQSHQVYLARLQAALAACSECALCQQAAARWATYPRSITRRLRFHVARTSNAWRQRLWMLAGQSLRLRRARIAATRPYHVCVPITVYPVGGGMRAVLAGWRQAMARDWTMEFLTAHIGPDTAGQAIYSFDPKVPLLHARAISPSLFPNVFGYVFAGLTGLLRLLRQVPNYLVLLPQDGVYTAAFAAIGAKLTGRRLVIVDHGNIRDLYDPNYAAERRQMLEGFPWPKRHIAHLRLALYLPTVRALAHFATRRCDHILAASDDVVEPYRRHLGVPAYRITRFPFMLDTERYSPPDSETRARQRAAIGLPEDAIVIIMVNRLHPMKGVDVGVGAIRGAIAALPAHLHDRVRILVVGDGPLREQVAADIRDSGLEGICRMWGEASANEVAMLLGISDIFLFSARRSINSMAVLEAMAAGCATVATVTSPHIAEYLADHRGIAAPVGDVNSLSDALSELISNDQQRREMGERARNYVMAYHTGEVVRRHLLRATYWQPVLAETALAVTPAHMPMERQGEV